MTRPLDAGEMQYRVTLQEKSSDKNSLGETPNAWADVATLWAKVVDQRSRKFFSADKIQVALDIEVRIRARPDVSSALRLMHAGDPYEILEVVTADAPDRHLQLLCIRGVGDGT